MIGLIKKIIKYFYLPFNRIKLKKDNIQIDKNVSFLKIKFSTFNRIYKDTFIDRSTLGFFT